MVGAGVFVTIPPLLGLLPGRYALLAWLAASALVLIDGLIWSELGAALPGSGGTYRYLLESYGPQKWGRVMAFLFIWQFIISGPLELGSGLIAIAQFSTGISPEFKQFNDSWTFRWALLEAQGIAVTIGPSRILGFLVGIGIIWLLFRNITSLGKITVTVWTGVMAVIGWILVEGVVRFSPAVAFSPVPSPPDLPLKVGTGMILAIYSFLGYYNVCYVGDEVRDTGRTIPRAILISVAAASLLYLGVHLALLGTVPWNQVPTDGSMTLPAEFMQRIHGPWAASLMSLLLVWCCFGSVFAGMLGYSRIPYGAARDGNFFSVFSRIHPRKEAPHLSLLLIGGMTLLWGFFDLQTIINALITTRILEQFVGQAIGVMLLRRNRPDLYRPYKMWLYPLPPLVALAGWLYVYFASGWLYITLGLVTLAAGLIVYLVWSSRNHQWPFGGGDSISVED
jgi:amino acid transporter